MSALYLIHFILLFGIMIASTTKRYTTSSLSITRSSNIILSSYCASIISTNNYVVNAFSTVSISPAVSSLLSDPTLLGDGISSSGDSISSSDGKKTFDVFNPGASLKQYNDGSIIGQVQKMGREDTKQAIDRASSALSEWKDGTTGSYRSNLLTKWSTLITENSEDIATIMTLESGKPLTESRGEVQYGVSFLDYFAAEAIRPSSAGGGYMVPTPFTNPDSNTPRGKILAINEAVGVCAFITPWNVSIFVASISLYYEMHKLTHITSLTVPNSDDYKKSRTSLGSRYVILIMWLIIYTIHGMLYYVVYIIHICHF